MFQNSRLPSTKKFVPFHLNNSGCFMLKKIYSLSSIFKEIEVFFHFWKNGGRLTFSKKWRSSSIYLLFIPPLQLKLNLATSITRPGEGKRLIGITFMVAFVLMFMEEWVTGTHIIFVIIILNGDSAVTIFVGPSGAVQTVSSKRAVGHYFWY